MACAVVASEGKYFIVKAYKGAQATFRSCLHQVLVGQFPIRWPIPGSRGSRGWPVVEIFTEIGLQGKGGRGWQRGQGGSLPPARGCGFGNHINGEF